MASTPLKVRPEHWFSAAEEGDVEQLERWHRRKVLTHRFDPSRVRALPGPGRPGFFRLLNQRGETALTVALKAFRAEYAIRLLELGGIHASQMKGQQAAFGLFCRFADGNLPLEKLGRLLLEQGHDLEAYIASKSSPLSYACHNANASMVKVLLDLGACVEPPAKNSPLCEAMGAHTYAHESYSSRLEVVRFLLEAGADPNRKSPTTHDTPLIALALSCDDSTDNASQDSVFRQILRMLLLAGANPEKEHREDDQLVFARDFLPAADLIRQAFDADCLWARMHRLSASLPSAPEQSPRPRF